MTPEIILEILKIGGVPALSVAAVTVLWLKQGPDRKSSEADAMNAEIAALAKETQSHKVRLAIIETTLKERGRR